MIFRATHGRALAHFWPYQLNGIEKAAYLVVFSMPGQFERVAKIVDSFLGSRFEIQDMNGLDRLMEDMSTKI